MTMRSHAGVTSRAAFVAAGCMLGAAAAARASDFSIALYADAPRGSALRAAPQPPSQQPAAHAPAAVASFREGVAAQQREAWEEAARAYQLAIDVEPRFAEAHANLGAVLARLGRYDDAVAAYERALAIAPALNTARINLGLAHFRVGEMARAVDILQTALGRDPASQQARALLGLALVDAGRAADAIGYLQAATTAAPDDPALLFALARAYAAVGDPRKDVDVEAIATRLSTLAAGRPLWYHLQGILHQRQGRHREALAAFTSARDAMQAVAPAAPAPGAEHADDTRNRKLAGGAADAREKARAGGAHAQPELPGLALAMGISRLALGEDMAAREAFEQARTQAPRDAVPLFYLGWLDERAGRLVPARDFAERALALDPKLFEARALLGRVLLGQGAFAEAARHLSMAAAHDGEDASIRYLLAQAYQRAGDAAAARREFDEARRLKAREVARERQP